MMAALVDALAGWFEHTPEQVERDLYVTDVAFHYSGLTLTTTVPAEALAQFETLIAALPDARGA
jgi:hypothetical protein